jgi:uncharacterized protein
MRPQSVTMGDSKLTDRAYAYAEEYMGQYDGSHDFKHVLRVLDLARRIAAASIDSKYDDEIITLAALLHDVGDKKYIKAGQNAESIVRDVLLGFGAPEEVAIKVQTIVTHVSYSSETKDPSKVLAVINQHPELAVVQDADRLDAIGAVGIGRTFTFGGAKSAARGMDGTIEHFTDKLEKLESMMKTEIGRELARVRTQRLREFRSWWDEEVSEARGPVDSSVS